MTLAFITSVGSYRPGTLITGLLAYLKKESEIIGNYTVTRRYEFYVPVARTISQE